MDIVAENFTNIFDHMTRARRPYDMRVRRWSAAYWKCMNQNAPAAYAGDGRGI